MPGQGKIENQYATAFADALTNDASFRAWVLRQTKFKDFADEARPLDREMQAKRSKTKGPYWSSWNRGNTRCNICSYSCSVGSVEEIDPGCDKETDIFVIFETGKGLRVSLHAEVKQPRDRFSEGQAAGYPVRAKCWATAGKTPKHVLPHTDATTILLFSETNRAKFARDIPHFDLNITFEAIEANFPNAVP